MANEQFYTILTKIGKAKIANAAALGNKVNIAKFQIGDGGGNYYNPTEEQTELKNKVWEGNIGSIKTDENNPNWVVLETVIPGTDGGFMVREAAAVDSEGNVIAIGKYPETYKPVAGDGSIKDLILKMILEVSNTTSVSLKVDPTVILATQKDILGLNDKIKTNKDNIEKMRKDLDIIEITAKKTSFDNKNSDLKSENVQDAINELFQYASNGKKNIAEVVGSPLLANDSFQQQVDKIKTLKQIFSEKLNAKNVTATENDELSNLINKINSIKCLQLGNDIESGDFVIYKSNEIKLNLNKNLYNPAIHTNFHKVKNIIYMLFSMSTLEGKGEGKAELYSYDINTKQTSKIKNFYKNYNSNEHSIYDSVFTDDYIYILDEMYKLKKIEISTGNTVSAIMLSGVKLDEGVRILEKNNKLYIYISTYPGYGNNSSKLIKIDSNTMSIEKEINQGYGKVGFITFDEYIYVTSVSNNIIKLDFDLNIIESRQIDNNNFSLFNNSSCIKSGNLFYIVNAYGLYKIDYDKGTSLYIDEGYLSRELNLIRDQFFSLYHTSSNDTDILIISHGGISFLIKIIGDKFAIQQLPFDSTTGRVKFIDKNTFQVLGSRNLTTYKIENL